MTGDMAEFIKRKKAAEEELSSGKPDQDKRREDIMKRVAERRKQREEQGAGTKSISASVSKLNEELKLKDAAHQKEVHELRKTIEDLHTQISKLNSVCRSGEQIQNDLDEEKKKVAAAKLDVVASQEQVKTVESKIVTLKDEFESERVQFISKISELKSEKVATDAVICNLQQQVDSLVEIKNSEASSDEKISQLSEDISLKNTEISDLKKDLERVNLEKEQLATSLQELQTSVTKEREQFKNEKCELDEQNFLLESDKKKLVKEVKDLSTMVDELHAINKELQKELEYQKSVVESQEQKLMERTQISLPDKPIEEDTPPAESIKKEPKEPASEVTESVRPSDSFEVSLINELNLLRKNPDAYTDYLVDLVECYDGMEFRYPGSDKLFTTKEGVNALEDAIEYLQSCQQSCPPLKLVDGLCKSCKYLCDQNGPTGNTSTTCSDGYVILCTL